MVQPWLEGPSTIRMGADTDRYWDAAQDAQQSFSFDQVFGLSANFLGPVILGLVFRTGFGILCCNVLLLLVALKVAFSIEGVHKALFGWLMLLNAELIPSLNTLNKEILAIVGAVLSAKYIYSKRPSGFLLACTLVISFFARWEQAVILVAFVVVFRSPLGRRPKLALALLILALTFIYPVIFRVFGIDPGIFDYLLEGGGLILKLDSIQASFGFPIVLPVKILMLMGGRLVQPDFYATGGFYKSGYVDYQQEIFQPLGCLAMLVVFVVAAYKGKMRVNRPVALLCAITLIVVAIAPFIQPRYVIPVYVLLSLELALGKNVNQKETSRELLLESR
jgi:hypothetical protein